MITVTRFSPLFIKLLIYVCTLLYPPLALIKGVYNLPKIKSLGGGVPKALLERGNNSEKKGGGVDVEMGG